MYAAALLLSALSLGQTAEIIDTPFPQESASFLLEGQALPAGVSFAAPQADIAIPGGGATLAVATKAGATKPTAVGTEEGLYLLGTDGAYAEVYPADDRYSWALRQVSAVAYDSRGRLWFGADNGVGVLDGDSWTLYTGAEGLPYKYFTCAAAGPNGEIWFGTTRGAIRFDGEHWYYRASKRWLPNDHVEAIAVDGDGAAYIDTPDGVAKLYREPMTLEKKSDYFIDQVETRHNRDGYITNWELTTPGDVTTAKAGITDNDGLYTSVYGAAMAFKYAATKDPEARELAVRSFYACKRLSDVVPESMKGFPARVLIPIDWHEPVNEQYSHESNVAHQKRDPFWKLITPRFPTSEDGKYMWKNDTSSDELAGHYFFNAIFYDLVAETEQEKEDVRQVVRDMTDHLIRNGYNLVDHDGKPTRWGRFGPDFIYDVYGWEQAGLNSMMMLSFLNVAEHVTGDAKYGETAKTLRDEYHYHINSMVPRPTFPPENIVPWDNNLALLSFYGLLNYEKDPELLMMYRLSLEHCWQFSSRQKSALWNFLYGACAQRFNEKAETGMFDGVFPEAGTYGVDELAKYKAYDQALGDSIETLQRIPLLLINWRMENTHRLDIELDPMVGQEPDMGWSRVDRKALPIDERGHVRIDRDAFALDYLEGGREGTSEHEGTFYLLPYWLGRYHGFLK